MLEILHEPKFWTATAFVLVVVFSYKKVSKLLLDTLDKRSARIKVELDEASRLRREAEEVLAEYKKKQAEYLKEAEAMLTDAKRDAQTLRTHAEKELKATLDARMKQSMERLTREEEKAVADVKNHVIDIALAAARSLIADHVGKLSQDELIQLAMADIERKIH